MKYIIQLYLFIIVVLHITYADITLLPFVLNTWGFKNATAKAFEIMVDNTRTSLDALVEGCSVCEREQCDGTVGYGGSPDENGETTLDAFIIDGTSMNMGAVAGLRQIKNAMVVARHVLENTRHSLLVGDLASDFAEKMGLTKEKLTTPESKDIYNKWRDNNCQPNFWVNVVPDPEKVCGPYVPTSTVKYCKQNSVEYDNERITNERNKFEFGPENHDTIGMIVVDKDGKVLAGTSTNGAKHKIPGRVGDSPIPGAGAYADSTVGAAVATGDGDVMMRFLPSFLAVEALRNGETPEAAAKKAIQRITSHYPKFVGAIIVARNNGDFSAACHGMDVFPFTLMSVGMYAPIVHQVKCN